MACILTRADGDPNCNFAGVTGSRVTLVVVPDNGNARFAAASYDGQSLIDAAAERITFTLKNGSKDLAVVFVFSENDATAHLEEDCADAEILDENISAVNNAKLYGICGRGAGRNAAASAGAKRAAAKSARKGTATKKRSRRNRRGQ